MKAPLLHPGCNVVDLLGKGMHLIHRIVRAKCYANRSVRILLWRSYSPEYFGTKRVTVHLTPSDEQTYRFLRDELRAKHRSEYRERRCMIPGKLKPLIPCPEKNSCKNCPYPQCRDSQLPDLSWDEYVDAMSGVAQADPGFEQLEKRMAIADAVKAIADQNPKFAQAILLKEYYGLSVAEIAQKLNDTERNIYYFPEARFLLYYGNH